MSEVYFAGDGHLKHKRICKYRPQFSTVEEHEEAILKAFDHVTKRDKTFFMGDWVFEKEALDIISLIPGAKHLVLGNHDKFELIPDMLKVFDHISGDLNYKEFWLTHIPIHPTEMRGKYNIYAHTHNAFVDDWRFYCTSMEQINYKAVSLQEIRKEFESRKEWVLSLLQKDLLITKDMQELLKIKEEMESMNFSNVSIDVINKVIYDKLSSNIFGLV